jgi:hypothetical protein
MAVYESVTLGGTELNDHTNFRIESFDAPPPPKRYEWATGADADGAALVRDPLHENRTITIRIRVQQQASMDTALAKIGEIVQLLEETENQQDGTALVWTPATSTKSLTAYVLSGEVTGMPIEKSGGDIGWFTRMPVVTIRLDCKPFLYGAEASATLFTASTLPLATGTIADVPGDVPAEARLIVTDAATQSRRHLEWGLQQRHYDAATSLIIDSDAMTILGGTGTTRSGAYNPDAAGNSVIRATLYSEPTAVCSTGNLAHVGTFRVKARIYATDETGDNTKIRLSWQSGDGPMRSNPVATPPATGAYAEIDLGTITIAPTTLGTQRWTGRIEAHTTGTSGTPTVDIDYLFLIPAGEGYGKARGVYAAEAGPLVAVDDFTGTTTGNALHARTPPLGGAWATSGDATDFVFSDSPDEETVTRSTNTLEGTGRRAQFAGSLTNTEVSTKIMRTEVGTSMTVRIGIPSEQINFQEHEVLAANTWYALRLVVFASGGYVATLSDMAGRVVAEASGSYFELATGGAYASGTAGIADRSIGAGAVTRYYDEVRVQTPGTEAVVVHSGQSAEIRHDGAIREDSTGTYWGDIPEYRGSRFLLPAAGSADRTSRIAVKARRNDVDTAADDQIADSLTASVTYTPRYLVAPR